MAGILDALFRAAPRVAAAGFAGRNQREQTEYDRAEKERAFQEKVKQQALEQELAQAQNLRSNQLAEAQMGEIAASAAERRARAEGTGAYAPKPEAPVRPRRTFKTNADGTVIAIDEDTLETTPVKGIRERVPSSGQSANPELKFAEVSRLRNEFLTFDKPYQTAKVSMEQMGELVKDRTGASDIALLYAAVKAVDPESVVREGEVALARGASSLADRIGVPIAQLIGKRIVLTDGQRQELLKAAQSRFGPMQSEYTRRRSYYERLAQQRGADPFEVVGEGGVPAPADSAGPAGPAAPTAKSRADRWEELVNSGMSAAQATAQVRREMP